MTRGAFWRSLRRLNKKLSRLERTNLCQLMINETTWKEERGKNSKNFAGCVHSISLSLSYDVWREEERNRYRERERKKKKSTVCVRERNKERERTER